MKRLFLFGIMALLAMAFTATANDTYLVDNNKDYYYDAVEALEAGTITPDQKQFLEDAGYRENNPGGGNQIDLIGGPDGAGYTFIDSDEAGGPVYDWYDITGGTNWAAADGLSDDDHIGPYDIGFNFGFYGETYSQFYIQSNGVINFSDQYVSLSNQTIPTDSYNALIAWFWDDMDPDLGTQGEVYFTNMMIGDDNALVISFHNWDEFNGSDTTPNITAQVILIENGNILIQYNNIVDGLDITSSTIGVQGNQGWAGLEYMYNNSYPGYPVNNLAILFEGQAPDASVSGTVTGPTGTPIAGATVMFGSATATTDMDGMYMFPALYSGPVSYSATAPGYLTMTGDTVLEPGANTVNIELEENNPNADMLIVDVDPTPNGDTIAGILNDLGYDTYYVTEFNETDFTAGYDAIFVFLGIYSNYYPVYTGDPEETMMVNYLLGGGSLYIEGGDVFGFNEPDNLLALLNLDFGIDGTADLSTVEGVAGTFTEGLSLAYTGENNYIDHISGINGATTIFTNPADGAGCGVVDNTMDWNSASISFELANLTDGDFTREDIVAGILDMWGMGGPTGPVTLDLMGTFTTIPPSGGTLTYDLHLNSTLGQTFTGVQYWTDVILPNGQTYGPLMVQPFTLVPFMDVFLTGLTQDIPAFAPGGMYTFMGHVGYNPGPQIMDDFEFEKIGTATDGVEGWNAGAVNLNQEVAGDATTTLPAEYELKDVYPNPFNPTANVTVALPNAADLNVVVFNVMGQQVAELASGQIQAGTHNFVLDGSSLASGIYFVQATVPGELNAVQKVTLMK